MLLEVDLAGIRILLVGLGFVFGSELPVLFAVAVDLMMKRGFFGCEMSALTRGQLASLEFGGAMLLTDVLGGGMLRVSGRGFGYLILMMAELGVPGGGDACVIIFTHVGLFSVQAGFFSFQARGFTSGEFAALNHVRAALLLIFLARLDRGTFGRFRSPRIGALRGDGRGQRSQSGREEQTLYRGLHTSMLKQRRRRGNACP